MESQRASSGPCGGVSVTSVSGAPRVGGYARRCPPGDTNSTDRRRLLADRSAYIAFLEQQAERASDAMLECEAFGVGLGQVRARVRELEEQLNSLGRAVAAVQEHPLRLEGQIRAAEGRVRELDGCVADARLAAEAEMARLRNEVMLAVQEFRQSLDERIQDQRNSADEGLQALIRRAQATCVRLADDALSAAEASQRKVDELAKRTEASLEVLRVDVTGVRAELAGTRREDLAGNSPGAVVGAVADEVERRVGSRLGQQVLQVSDVLRRVVRAQVELHRQCGGKAARCSPRGGSLSPGGRRRSRCQATAKGGGTQVWLQADPSCGMGGVTGCGGPCSASNERSGPHNAAAGDAQRCAAIDELYRELWQLEANDPIKRHSSDRGK